MANNRIWLIHRPTGASVCLGKRMGVGWYVTSEPGALGKRIIDFFAHCGLEGGCEGQDDFLLAMEDASGAPGATDKFTYNQVSSELFPKLKDDT